MKLKNILPLLFVTISASAFADGPYILGEVTHSKLSLNNAKLDSDLTAAGATGVSSNNDGSGNQWRFQAGYKFNSYFAVEAGYIDLGTAKYNASFAGGSAQGSDKAAGLDLVVLGILPISNNLSIFGKTGLVAAKVKTELSSSAPVTVSISDSSTELRPLLGMGTMYSIQKNVDLRVDYDHVSGLGNSGKGAKITDNMLSAGISYNF